VSGGVSGIAGYQSIFFESKLLSLNQLFREEFQGNVENVDFKVKDFKFNAAILRYRTGTQKTHSISYCLNGIQKDEIIFGDIVGLL
jgi:predicted 3-demethylubiquinone-9 3-methyltransferase (glyoxalase superfamily)